MAPIIQHLLDRMRIVTEGAQRVKRLPDPNRQGRFHAFTIGHCVCDHPRTRKMVPKENIIDKLQGQRQTSEPTDLLPVPTNKDSRVWSRCK
jgi:hypothetical protein